MQHTSTLFIKQSTERYKPKTCTSLFLCKKTEVEHGRNKHLYSNKQRRNSECEQEIEVNHEMKNHNDIDLGYELENMVKKWCDDEDEGRIYDNLD